MEIKSYLEMVNVPELEQKYGALVGHLKHYSNIESLNKETQVKAMIMLESAVKNYCTKNRIPTYNRLMETMTTSTDAATFVTTQMPMILKVFPAMIASELVSVQPMSQPDQKVFYYDVKRDDGTSTSTAIHTNRNYSNNVEYNEASPTPIRKIKLTITGTSVSATKKKLQAEWTTEAQADIYNYHGINIDTNLSDALVSDIASEWDRTIIQALLDGATGGTATFNTTEPGNIASYEDRKYWMETIVEKCIDVDTAIFTKTYRKTNWMIVPASIGGFLEKLDGFQADSGATISQKVLQSGGRYYAGNLSNRWRIYVDPFFPADKILMGMNGNNWLDTSFVFSPYILTYFSDTFENPDTFVKTKSILSRAAMFYARPDYCGVVTLTSS